MGCLGPSFGPGFQCARISLQPTTWTLQVPIRRPPCLLGSKGEECKWGWHANCDLRFIWSVETSAANVASESHPKEDCVRDPSTILVGPMFLTLEKIISILIIQYRPLISEERAWSWQVFYAMGMAFSSSWPPEREWVLAATGIGSAILVFKSNRHGREFVLSNVKSQNL